MLPLTKSCPRLRGKWHGVAMTKGERLEAAKLFYYSPSGNPPKLSPGWNKVALLTFVRNSPCSCPFFVSLHPPQAALNSKPRFTVEPFGAQRTTSKYTTKKHLH